MTKHTQTIRQQIADELFESVWPFCEIGAKRFKPVLISSMINFVDGLPQELPNNLRLKILGN